jgi:RNA polymerase sigma factor (TIGR02999 family)
VKTGDGPQAAGAGALTRLLRRRAGGDLQVDAELLALVYDDLRALAARQLSGERAGHTLSPTALVHEAYLRLGGDPGVATDRRHFYALAAQRMRQVLVDHARRRDAGKRGGGAQRVPLTLSVPDPHAPLVDALALDQALQRLEELDPRKVRVVELRFFAGLEMAEIAAVLGVSRATAQRDWEVARTFLYQSMA